MALARRAASLSAPARLVWVALFALVVSVSAWLPWLTTTIGGGGWASAIGGKHGSLELPPGFGAGQLIVLLSSILLVAGAMVARGLSVRFASIAALVISLLIVALVAWYYKLNVNPPVSAEYGLYVGGVAALCAGACSISSVIAAVAAARSRRSGA